MFDTFLHFLYLYVKNRLVGKRQTSKKYKILLSQLNKNIGTKNVKKRNII